MLSIMELNGSPSTAAQYLTTEPCAGLIQLNTVSFKIHFNIIPLPMTKVFQVISFYEIILPKVYIHFLPPPYALMPHVIE
jgi:hypothetical protein